MCSVLGSFMSKDSERKLETEFISFEARTRFRRIISQKINNNYYDNNNFKLILLNRFINLSNAILERSIYQLDLGGEEYYLSEEYAWHEADFLKIFRISNTIDMVKILIETIEWDFLELSEVNNILKDDCCGFELYKNSNNNNIEISFTEYNYTPNNDLDNQYVFNLRLSVERMKRAYDDKDWTLVLQSGAVAIEVLSKQVIKNKHTHPLSKSPEIEACTFTQYVDSYKNHSHLAEPLISEMEKIFKKRNVEPMAGHGSTKNPTITQEDALYIKELIVALIRLESNLTHIKNIKKSG